MFNVPTDAIQCAAVSHKILTIGDQDYCVARVVLLDLLYGQAVFPDAQAWYKYMIFHL